MWFSWNNTTSSLHHPHPSITGMLGPIPAVSGRQEHMSNTCPTHWTGHRTHQSVTKEQIRVSNQLNVHVLSKNPTLSSLLVMRWFWPPCLFNFQVKIDLLYVSANSRPYTLNILYNNVSVRASWASAKHQNIYVFQTRQCDLLAVVWGCRWLTGVHVQELADDIQLNLDLIKRRYQVFLQS